VLKIQTFPSHFSLLIVYTLIYFRDLCVWISVFVFSTITTDLQRCLKIKQCQSLRRQMGPLVWESSCVVSVESCVNSVLYPYFCRPVVPSEICVRNEHTALNLRSCTLVQKIKNLNFPKSERGSDVSLHLTS
jgi:hypothetical protein